MPDVILTDLADGYQAAISNGLERLGSAATLRPGDRVTVKPNLTYPVYRPGVMTRLEAIEALVKHLKEAGCQVTVCESDSGGYNRFSMDDVFRATGLVDLAARYDIRLLNLSGGPSRDVRVRAGLRRLRVPLPLAVTDETDLFITMPVPKVHANTILSGAIKNQWGVIQDPRVRLRLHPFFPQVIHAVHQALPRTIVIMDGAYGLDRNGPMRGDAVELGWLLASDSVVAADLVMAKLMGFDWRRVPHMAYMARCQPDVAWDEIECNPNHRQFQRARFHLEREWTDLAGWCTFHSRLLAWLGYDSPFAAPLHRLLYCFREPFY